MGRLGIAASTCRRSAAATIPYYRLPSALRDHPELNGVGRLTLWNSLKGARLSLWCESRKKLVSFSAAQL